MKRMLAVLLCMLLVCTGAFAAVEFDVAAFNKDLGITKEEYEHGVDFSCAQLLGYEVTWSEPVQTEDGGLVVEFDCDDMLPVCAYIGADGKVYGAAVENIVADLNDSENLQTTSAQLGSSLAVVITIMMTGPIEDPLEDVSWYEDYAPEIEQLSQYFIEYAAQIGEVDAETLAEGTMMVFPVLDGKLTGYLQVVDDSAAFRFVYAAEEYGF